MHGFHISILSHDVYSNEQQFALIQPNKLCNLYWVFYFRRFSFRWLRFFLFGEDFSCCFPQYRSYAIFILFVATRGLGTMSSAANTDRIVVHSDIVFIKLECIKCIPLNRHETVSNVRAQCRYIRYRIYFHSPRPKRKEQQPNTQ